MPAITIKENNKEMIVFYPDTGDKSETEELRQFAISKTTADLRKAKPRPAPKYSQKQSGEILKELNQWRNEKKLRERNRENSKRYW